jgi:hypothetical protein
VIPTGGSDAVRGMPFGAWDSQQAGNTLRHMRRPSAKIATMAEVRAKKRATDGKEDNG